MRHIGRNGAGMCSRGARQWCEFHRIDFLAFVRDGVDIERVRHIQCPLLARVIEVAEKEAQDGQR